WPDFGADPVVVASDALHGEEEQRHGDGHDPGSMGELGDQNDDQNDGGKGGAGGVDGLRAPDPGSGASRGTAGQFTLPMSDHAELGEGEGDEDPNDVQLNDRTNVRVE